MRSSSSGPGSPVSTEEIDLSWSLTSSSPNVFYIDILPESSGSSIIPDIDYTNSLEGGILCRSHGSRPIRAIKPSLAFTSNIDSSLDAYSLFTVSNGEAEYEDRSPLAVDLSTPIPEGAAALYTCNLVPNYWDMICHSSNPTQFTIYHTVQRDHASSLDSTTPLFSATYKFRYMPQQRLRSPQSNFTTVTSGINASQDVHGAGREWFHIGNISELSSNDYKNWQECVAINEHRGYDSLPASPGWDEFRPQTLDGNCSSCSSPTTPSFPSESQLYLSH
jgi:transcriptional enhancer factor